jgi:hypothetical protein
MSGHLSQGKNTKLILKNSKRISDRMEEASLERAVGCNCNYGNNKLVLNAGHLTVGSR